MLAATASQGAVVTRYFSTTGAGAGNGTSWADRAALFQSGAWSSIISGFNFTSDSLRCLVGPGEYTCGQSLTSSITGTPDPSSTYPLLFQACDSSGVPYIVSPPFVGWTPDKPITDTTGMPTITFGVNAAFITLQFCDFSGFYLRATNRISGVAFQNVGTFCSILENAGSGAAAGCSSGWHSNTILRCSGSIYDYVLAQAYALGQRLRIEGNPNASGGRGIVTTAAAYNRLVDYCVTGNVSGGIVQTSTSVSAGMELLRVMVINNPGDGIVWPASAVAALTLHVGSVVTGNGGYGINLNGSAGAHNWNHVRVRDNVSGNFSAAHPRPVHMLYDADPFATKADADAAEYMDASAGDFRIKASAAIASMGFGISIAKPTVAY